MSIRIVKRPADVFVTEDDLARYKEQHQKTFAMYSGTPPSLEEYIRQKQTEKMQRTHGPRITVDMDMLPPKIKT